MKKKTKYWLMGSGAVVAGAAALKTYTHAASRYMVRLAMDRKGPRAVERQRLAVSGRQALPAMFQHLEKARRQLEEAGCRQVELESHDGLRLVGHWYPAAQTKRILIAMHGWRSQWSRDFGVIAPFWHQQGCSVLFAEQRGQGRSDGQYMGFGMLERFDCQRWANWAAQQIPQAPIYLVGISMGAATVLMSADLALPRQVQGIMADCGFTSAQAIWKHVAERNLHLHYGLYASAANGLCRKKIQMGAQAHSTLKSLARSQLPVLLVHGTDDSFVPVEMTYANYKACAGPKHLLIVPGADHGMSYFMDKAGYETAMKAFWARYDEKPCIQ